MHAARLLIAFLLLVSLGLGYTNVVGNQPTYNPGDNITLSIISDNSSINGYHVYVNFTNSTNYAFSCSSPSYVSLTALANCTIPSNLANGTWNITAINENQAEPNTTVQFTLNATVMNLSIPSPKNFAPGTSFTLYVNMTYQNGAAFNMNKSSFNISSNVSDIVSCSSLANTTAGNYTSTCTINSIATAGIYLFSGSYPNSLADDTFNVSVVYGLPNIALNISSFRVDNGTQSYMNITIRSNSNINETLNITIYGCDGENLTCSIASQLGSNQTNISAFGTANATLNVTALLWANSTYSITVNVTTWDNASNTKGTALSVTVNPLHNFSLTSSSGTGSMAAGSSIQYNFTITNDGTNTSGFNFSCTSNSSHFGCYSNLTNNITGAVAPGGTAGVMVTVLVLSSAFEGEDGRVTINVTDTLGLSKIMPDPYFKTTALASLGSVTVTNISQYVHYPSETYSFNISVNNTGNIDGEQAYNITIVSQNISNWGINISNGSSSVRINDTTVSYTLNLSIPKLSSANLSVTVVVPATANSSDHPKLFVMAVSKINGTRFSENSTVIIKIPSFSFTIVMNYSNATETLNFSIQNVTKEGSAVTSFSNITFFILNQSNGKPMANNTNATLNMAYSNSTVNVDVWSSGAYVLNITGSTTPDTPYNLSYNFSFSGVFFIARWIGFSMPTLPSTASGTNFNVAIGCYFGNTSNVTNASVYSQKPTITYFNGGNCSSFPSVSGMAFTYTCTPTATTNSTYVVKAQITAASCSSDFTCTFIPVHFTNGSSTVVITYTPGSSSSNPPGSPGGSNASNQSSGNRTTITATGLKFTVPSNVSLTAGQTITIILNNTNTSRQNITMNASEASDYIHFNLTFVAPKNITGNSTLSVNITLTPFKWAKPGAYTVTITINSVSTTLTVTIPQSNDTKKLHRYVEVSKDRAKSIVTLTVKNRNSYSVFMNVTENISKQIAASVKNLTITSAINYTVIEQDPVIMWMMNMTSGQEKSIIYLVGGDLGNSNLFVEPNISEGRMSTGGGGGTTAAGGMDMWLIIGIIVVVVIAAGVVVYLFFLKPRGIKLPIKYGAFAKQEKKGGGVLGALKGIPGKVMSLFKREKKEPIAGEKKGLFGKLSLKKKPAVKEEPKKEERKIEPGKPKPTKEDLLKKLNEVYKK